MLHRIASFLTVLVMVSSVASARAADEKPKTDTKKLGRTAKPDDRKSPQRRSTQLKPGDMAPDFELKTLDGKRTVKLSSFRGKKPVALIFGSYT
jgi:hypothetical protein